jgi:hypothetical protein
MLNATTPVDSPFTRRPAHSPSPLAQTTPPGSRYDRDAIRRRWSNAFIHFDARIRMLRMWSKDVSEVSSRLELDWCIASLADVRSALYQLHVRVVDDHLPLIPPGSPIVVYVSEAYVWCNDVLEDVQALVRYLRGGSSVRISSIAEDSSAYIDDFLEPLFQEVCESCCAPDAGEPLVRALLPLVERLHVAIVSLDWVLRAA